MINDLTKLIAINSVEDTPSSNAPFGKNVRLALDTFLEMASGYGLETGEIDGYAAWAEYGKGDIVGVLAHIDIVPAGSGWATNPFALTIDDGKIYGRGVADDKGSIVAALHAIKEIKDSGIKLNNRVRLIVGGNEESGCECMKKYVQCCELPKISFTPDSDFPVVCSEKGILHLRVDFADEEYLRDNFSYIGGGERANIVPARAECVVRGQLLDSLTANPPSAIFRREAVLERLAMNKISHTDFECVAGDGMRYAAVGQSAHASTPEKGDNAIAKLFAFLSAVTPSPSVQFVSEYFGSDAENMLGIAVSDEQSGKLTFNMGMVNLNGGKLSVTLDLRLPVSISADEVVARIKAKLPSGASVVVLAHQPNLYVDENSPLVTTLLAVHEKNFGIKGKPLKIGGGTYAKTLPNCVAFGPTPYGDDFHIHDADEYMPLTLFYKLKDVYKDAILELDKII